MPEIEPFDASHPWGVEMIPARTPGDIAAATVAAACSVGILAGQDVLIVSPTNVGLAGTSSLNGRLHHLRRERDGLNEIRGAVGERFSVGDSVLFRRNDYRRGLFNGSLGTVVSIDPDRRSMVARFEDVEHDLEASDMLDVSLGYALTCHRAQGSQADVVILALPQSRLLDPSWLYTAVTRAVRRVVIVGEEATLRQALAAPWASDTRRVGFAWNLSPSAAAQR